MSLAMFPSALASAGKTLAPAAAALAALAGVVEVGVSSYLGDSTEVIGTQAGAMGYEAILGGVMVHSAEAHRNTNVYDDLHTVVYQALPLIFLAIGVIQGLEMLNGYGSPEGSERFNEGANAFSGNIGALIKGANANIDWSGGGAEEYNRLNLIQAELVAKVAQADWTIANILNNQARQVELGRELFAGARLVLLGSITVLGALLADYQSYIWSEAISDGIAGIILCFTLWVVGFAVVEALGPVLYLLSEGGIHQGEIQDEWHNYRSVAKSSDPINLSFAATAEVPGVAESAIKLEFSDIVTALSGTADRVNGLSESATASFTAVGQAAQSGLALSQVISRQAAPYVYLANQMQEPAQQLRSQIQQLVSQAKQTPPHDPAKDDSAKDDTAGADPAASADSGDAAAPDKMGVARDVELQSSV